MYFRIYLQLFAALTSLRFPGICLGTLLHVPLMCNVTTPSDTNQTYCLCADTAEDGSCNPNCLEDAEIPVSRIFRMTCNGGSTDGIYSLILKHIQPTTSSGSRGLLSRITGSTETISSLKVDDKDEFDGPWNIVFANRQHMEITLSAILDEEKMINVISQDVQLSQDSDVIDILDSSAGAQCFQNNDRIYTCNHTAANFILVSVCNSETDCRRFRCSGSQSNIMISMNDNGRPRVDCNTPSTEQPSNQIWITLVEGIHIHNITLHLLSFTDLSPAVPTSADTTTQPLTSTVETTTTTTRRTTEGTTLEAATIQQEPGTTERSSVAQASTESINPVIPVVIVVVVVFLIVIISGVICYKRRQLSRSKDRDSHLDAPATVLNPSFTTSAVDQNDYIECTNAIEGASNVAMPLSSDDNQHNEYFELSTSVPPTRQGDVDIYNEVGEQDYNVLFGGKEQGDYHEYNLPETAQKAQSGPYQDLMKDRIKGGVTSPKGTLLKGVEHALNDDNDKIFQPQNKDAPTERDSHAYQDLREDDSSYTSVLRDDGASTSPVAKNPAINHIYKTQTLQDQDEEYPELPSLVSSTKHDNGDIYNEVGEQDYNVLFGGKEQGDYHEYNLPECAQKTTSGPYQELLKGGKQDLHGQTKHGVPNETVDQGYQDLRKDETDYTSLHLNANTRTKPESSSSVASMNNTYQALQTSGPDYAILEPNTNDPSPAYPKSGSLPNNDYQSLEKNETGSDDTARGFDQGGVSMKQDASQDNTYQHLIKDDNTPASMNGYTKATEKEQGSTYDVLQHGPKTSGHPPSNGYGSLGMTTETEDLDPGAEPQATSDYEVPKQEISEEPYDNLQRKELSKTAPNNPGTMTEKSADDDDYENPSSSLDDETNTYQTLDNLKNQGNEQNGVDEDYSHLQRPLGNTVSSDGTGVLDIGNQYGKLNFANESK